MGPRNSPTSCHIARSVTTSKLEQTHKFPPITYASPTITPPSTYPVAPVVPLPLGRDSVLSNAPLILMVPGLTPPIVLPNGNSKFPFVTLIGYFCPVTSSIRTIQRPLVTRCTPHI